VVVDGRLQVGFQYGVSLLVFVATSKQAFDNDYFLVSGALLLGVAALPGSPLWGIIPHKQTRP
jgi:hypothetical protein